MLSLVYASSASYLFSDQELVELLRISRIKNADKGLTGMLLYRGGNFIQALEGPDDAVRRTFDKIKLDPRHRGILVLSDQKIEIRQFGDWSMGFTNVDKVPPIEGKTRFLKEPFVPQSFTDNPQRAYLLLQTFKENFR